jgi:3-isopropylmalate/(R)-2-methylmalate dehydratase small subunit
MKTLGPGRCCLLRVDNIDTDVIIPQLELMTLSKSGLADGLFAGWRYLRDREEDPAFVLNRGRNRACRFLLAGANFGCGSSREHAVWALAEYGIRAVVAPKFGDIFYRNCIRNKLLPARISSESYPRVADLVDAEGGFDDMTIDVAAGAISVAGMSVNFDLDDEDRRRLWSDLDEIDETLAELSAIEAFVERDRALRPWVYDAHWRR